jgi:murein DD-endopeptidase MepM/ murein hydrolase activator NlpD
MKHSRGFRQLTFFLIPDADRRIVRWTVPRLLLYLLPVFLAGAVLSVILAFTIVLSRTSDERAGLVRYYTGRIRELSAQTSDQHNQLVRLQSDLADLARQAEQFRQALGRVRDLEQELYQMTGIPPAADAASEEGRAFSAQNQGGEQLDISACRLAEFVASTREDYSRLNSEVQSSLQALQASEQYLKEMERLRRATPSIWPTSSHIITSRFGIRRDPFNAAPAFHSGLDIAGRLNDPVYATADGKVAETGSDALHGNYVVIRHESGLDTRYMHLNRILVKAGQQVVQGTRIGTLGSTGRSTGPHVHYQVEKKGQPVDPAPYLKVQR